jgi:hypothetical protein
MIKAREEKCNNVAIVEVRLSASTAMSAASHPIPGPSRIGFPVLGGSCQGAGTFFLLSHGVSTTAHERVSERGGFR